MEDMKTDINIDEIFKNNPEIVESISGVNVTMKVHGQRRVGNLWNRLTKEAGEKCAELEVVTTQYDTGTKTERWSDQKIMEQLGRLAHLLGYLRYLSEEKWHSSKQVKSVAYKCTNSSNDFIYKFEEIVELLNEKNEKLGKQISEKFSMNVDGEIFSFWFRWIKWEEVASHIGDEPEDRVAFIESLKICKEKPRLL